jgi:hypothetical protein
MGNVERQAAARKAYYAKKNIQKALPEIEFVKTPERQIQVKVKKISPIKSATSIKSSDLYSDANFELRDQFEFDIDKENERSETGIVVSREGIDNWKLELASARFIFDRDTSEAYTDTEFKELFKKKDPNYGLPIVDQFEYENVTYHEADEFKRGARKLAYNIGETHVLSSWANGIIVFVANAYNYEDAKGRKNRDKMNYTWYFSADTKRNFNTDVQNKIVGKGRKLLLDNVQRFTTGRYYCEISNDKGVTRTMPHYVNVYRDGRIVELTGGAENNIPLGRFEWAPIKTTADFDKKHPKLRPYKDYILEEETWVPMQYNSQANAYERADLASPDKTPGKTPWNTNEKIKWVKENSMKGNTIDPGYGRKMGYWKYSVGSIVYWSDSDGIVSFFNVQKYYRHREEMGYKKDFSQVEVFNKKQNNPYYLKNDNIAQYRG